MGAETRNQVTAAAGAVFLSYASQDADAARQICGALRAAGIEVWFDKSQFTCLIPSPMFRASTNLVRTWGTYVRPTSEST